MSLTKIDKEQLFELLLSKHGGAIRKRCFLWSWGNDERGQDAYQDVLLAIWEQLDRLDVNLVIDNERLWVVNITRRTLQAYYGKPAKECVLTDEHIAALIEANADERSATDTINELKAYLEHSDKLLLEYIIEGYDNKDIAILMNVHPNTINQRKHRLIDKMREIYNKLYNK